jgi:hypothetical protein
MSSSEISFEIHDMIDDIVQANSLGTDFPTENNIHVYMLIRQVIASLPPVRTENYIVLPWEMDSGELESEPQLRRNSYSQIVVNSQKYNTLTTTYNTCSICIDEFDDNDGVDILKCNHVFHTKCITEWGHYKCECPICRQCLKE